MPDQDGTVGTVGPTTNGPIAATKQALSITGHRRIQRDLSGETSHNSMLFCDGVSERWRERYGDY